MGWIICIFTKEDKFIYKPINEEEKQNLIRESENSSKQ